MSYNHLFLFTNIISRPDTSKKGYQSENLLNGRLNSSLYADICLQV
nr:MAG TPA: hypothetical protein [Caudoviricetes sp.]